MAAGQGLEPQLTAPEAVVLPLDEPAIFENFHFLLRASIALKVHLPIASLLTS